VRDGTRARQLAQQLFEATRHPDAAQTYAMALAETGQFDEAAKLQRETMRFVERQAPATIKAFMARNLALFEGSKPVREGWPADDPSFAPRSAAVALSRTGPAS
jgi:hypothetical protein